MNLFYLDDDLETCVRYHMDSHVQKIPLEVAQMMSSNIWVDHIFAQPMPRALTKEETKFFNEEVLKYKKQKKDLTFTCYWPAYTNHPCTIWMRTSTENWYWSFCYANELDLERVYRGSAKSHRSVQLINKFLPEPQHIPVGKMTTPAAAVGDSPIFDSVVETYRYYYIHYKSHLAAWKNREVPFWYKT